MFTQSKTRRLDHFNFLSPWSQHAHDEGGGLADLDCPSSSQILCLLITSLSSNFSPTYFIRFWPYQSNLCQGLLCLAGSGKKSSEFEISMGDGGPTVKIVQEKIPNNFWEV